MTSPFRVSLHWAILALSIPGFLAGQLIPFTAPSSILDDRNWPPDTVDRLITPDAIALAGGGFVVVAERYSQNSDVRLFRDRGFGRLVAEDGTLGATFDFGLENDVDFVNWPLLAEAGAGGFTVAWRQSYDLGYGLIAHNYGPGAVSLGDDIRVSQTGEFESDLVTSAAGNRSGRVVLGWMDYDFQARLSRPVFRALRPAAPAVPLGFRVPDTEPSEVYVGMDQASRIVAVWPEEGKVIGRWFQPDGTPLGTGPFQIAGGSPVALAAWPNGTFAVAWLGPGAERSLFVRHFAPDGRPLRSVFPLGQLQRYNDIGVSLSADRDGNLAVLWPDASRGGKPTLMLFNRSLIFQDRVELEGESKGGVALADSGRLLAAVEDRAQIFQVRREDDACEYHATRLLCDTGGIVGRHDEALFLGSGSTTDAPLVGDADGDGRDDLCLDRGGAIRCDSGHDGFPAEVRFPAFKPLGGQMFLGDVDGDGRAEACHYRDGFFRCDLARDGGKPDLVIAFKGLAGDVPLLGDVNGDGKDEPCLYRNGLFACDTARNGGIAETKLNLRNLLGGVRGKPLLGDVNGDGRDDACVVGNDRLICGSLLEGAASPVLVADRPWLLGFAGQRPFLGNVDGF